MSELTRLNEQKEREPCLKSGEIKITVMQWTSNRKVVLDMLMAGWGLGTWLGVNGLYVQLPLLVQRLPEQWALPSSMVLAIQLANAGLLFYAIARRLFRNTKDTIYIYCLLTIGLLSLSLNSFLYPRTAMIGSSERSVAFLSLTFFAALVGCTSSVLFYPYLRHFRDVYLATYLVGEGLSGFLPSIIAIIQGVGGDPVCVPSADNSTLVPVSQEPLFNTTVFFIILAGLSALSLVSFILIDNCKAFDSERVTATAVAKDDEAHSVRESLLSPRWVCVLALTACLNALSNGVLPSVQSYSCMPYGYTAYHLAVTLGAMANPAACLAGIWLKPISPTLLATTLGATLVPLCYILATALLSPAPPLQHLTIGTILIVASWVMTSGVVSYGRMWVYGWARRGGARGMRACGTLTQLGSALGSLLLFLLVNYANIFREADSIDCNANV